MFTGCLDFFGSGNVIGSNLNPQAIIEVTSGQRVVDLGSSIHFDASNSIDEDGSIVSYYWDFGDGSTGDKQLMIHKYSMPGEYIVSLSVTDDKGAVGDNNRGLTYITVLHGEVDEDTGLPHAIISVKASVIQAGTEIELNGAGSWSYLDGSPSTSEITAWVWDFGDGTTDSEVRVNHTFGSSGGLSSYTSSGSYLVKLTVTNKEGLVDTVCRTIRVVLAEVSSLQSPNPKVYTSVSIGDPKTLDPAEAYDSASGAVLSNTYETLIFYDRDKEDTLIPILAEEVPTVSNGGISPDGLTYTFNIRQDVTFHDKSELTAEDVVFSINRLLIMGLGPSWMYAELLDDTDEDGDGIVDSIVQIDQYTVQFTLKESAPRFLAVMAYTAGSIVSKDWVSSKGCSYPSAGVECTGIQKEVMGTGPYMMNEDYGGKWVPEQYVVMQYYPGYWRGWTDSERQSNGITVTGYIETVFLKKNNDQSARLLDLKSGNADSVYIEPNYVDIALEYEGINYEPSLPSLTMLQISFNHNISNHEGSAPSSDFFANEDVRKGFCYSFDYDTFITDVIDNRGIQPTGPIPKGLLGYNANGPKYNYDPSMAEMHFKEAGVWEDGFTLDAYYNLGNDVRLKGLLLLENTLEALNPKFDLVIQGLEWPVFLDKLKTREIPIFMLGWGADYADPHNFAHPFLHGADGYYPSSYLGFQYDDIDDLITAAASETDRSTREQMYFELAELEHDKALHIWAYQPVSYKIWKSWVNGWYHNSMHSTLYYTLSKS
jgi:peptide/nickel transport system substrate-binding protein